MKRERGNTDDFHTKMPRTGSVCVYFIYFFSLLLPTYKFAPAEEELVSCQGEVAGLPAFDKLPADLFLLQLSFDQRLPFLVHN